jgi:hypothetical protein
VNPLIINGPIIENIITLPATCTSENNNAPGLNKAILIQNQYDPPDILAQTMPVYVLVNKSYENVAKIAKLIKIFVCLILNNLKSLLDTKPLKQNPKKA